MILDHLVADTRRSALSNGDRSDKRAPGAAEEGTAGADQEPGVGQDPDDSQHRQPAEDVATEIDIDEIRPEIDKDQGEKDQGEIES
ncbi:MAG: hypothetical protein M3O70_24630 [Actinomycetota bacterium]|nr:hypothetical protein [Actinomycetota bacterium]